MNTKSGLTWLIRSSKNKYYLLSKTIKKCVDFVKNNDLVNYENGSYIVDDDIKVNINDFICSDTPKYEGHRQMIDIQIDLTGSEKCYVSHINNGKIEVPYDIEKDVEWFSVNQNLVSEIVMNNENIIILFPEDIHSPNIFNGCKTIKKAIFKISCEKF